MENGCNILFVKTAKCATETIREYLSLYAADKGLTLNGKMYNSFYDDRHYNINTNHIFYNEKTLEYFDKKKDKSLPSFTISAVRKPIERLYSHFCYGNKYYWQEMDFNEWYIKSTKGEIDDGWSVKKWGDKSDNYMWDYMGIESLSSIHKQYDHIFIREKFETSLRTFEELINHKFKRIPPKNTHTYNYDKNRKKVTLNPNFKFEQETIDLFNENNEKDNSLYEYVYTHF